MQSVNIKNWTHTRYTQGNFMALITFGSSPEAQNGDELEYYVTVLEEEIHESFQERFNSLSEACFYLNNNYKDWAFEDQTAPKSGCSTCAAH